MGEIYSFGHMPLGDDGSACFTNPLASTITSMNSSLPTPVVPSRPLARLGESHGYLIDGDAAHLRATFRDIAPEAHDRSWALQLWACPAVPQSAAGLDGHLVAEAWLPPLAEFEEAGADFSVVAAAVPPAGSAEWVMVLVLVAARGERFDEVHDLAAYPRHERFIQPRLEGEVQHVVSGDSVHLEVPTIMNPRPAGNVSGTLSLELWALPGPYVGGRFEGAPLAGVVLGTLAGQERWQRLAFDLPYVQPLPGTWQSVVMLREWNGSGYITRDFVNVGGPIVIAPPPTTAAPAKKPRVRKPADASAVAPKRAKKSSASKG